MHVPRCAIASCLAILFVRMLTESCILPLKVSWNDRSRMHQKALDLCGIIAAGDIFNFIGKWSLMSPHLTTRPYRLCCFTSVSSWSCRIACLHMAERCAPRRKRASRSSHGHGLPQSTGHPFSVYCWRRGMAGWSTPYGGLGRMRPRNSPISGMTGMSAGMTESLLSACSRE